MDYKKKFFKKIKQYYLCKELCKNLFLSFDEKTKKICIVKALPKKVEQNKLVQLKNEINDFMALKTENLINLLSYESSSNNIYLIYEYCNGGNLKNFLEFYKSKKGPQVILKLIQNIIIQIVNGLESLQNKNKVIGYLSLNNIFINFDKIENTDNNGLIPEKINLSEELLEENFTIKISNLIYLDDKEEIMKNINNIKNMSPEIVEHLKNNENNLNINKESDIWSLGCIVYELLFGESAFVQENTEKLIDKILLGKYIIPKEFIQFTDIMLFINGLLQYFPNKRFDLNKIKEHNFLTKNPEDFLKMDDFDIKIKNGLEINSKECENILWALLELKKEIAKKSEPNNSQEKEENKENQINENIINENENIIKESENIIKESENIINVSENIINESENIINENENIMNESENIINENESEEEPKKLEMLEDILKEKEDSKKLEIIEGKNIYDKKKEEIKYEEKKNENEEKNKKEIENNKNIEKINSEEKNNNKEKNDKSNNEFLDDFEIINLRKSNN